MASTPSSGSYDLAIVTPTEDHSLRSFSLSQGNVQQTFLVSTQDGAFLDQQKASFLQSYSKDQSILGLVFEFLQFLLDEACPPAPLGAFLGAIESQCVRDANIHDLVVSEPEAKNIIRTYYRAHAVAGLNPRPAPSGLFSTVNNEAHRILMAFGGQGSTNLVCVDELADLYSLYQPLLEPLIASVAPALASLSREPSTLQHYLGREIDLYSWLTIPESRPDRAFTATAAVSFPIIGLLDMAHYYVLGKLLDSDSPKRLRSALQGLTGHSQGIIVAAAVAQADTWASFLAQAQWAIRLLFWMGYECHTAAPASPLSSAAIRDSIEHGEGSPSWLLSVRGLRSPALDALITDCNRRLPESEHLSIGLINTERNIVVAGSPRSLRGLCLRLREIEADDGQDQSRVPFRQRKPVVHHTFLPVSAPFHSSHLRAAADRVKERFPDASSPQVGDLLTAVYHTRTGQDMREMFSPSNNLIHSLVEAVACETVDWPATLQVSRSKPPSHIVLLSSSRLSDLVSEIVDGRGVRIIAGTVLAPTDPAVLGGKAELLTTKPSQAPTPWAELFKARLVAGPDGRPILETRLSQLLQAPPIITAGMTPTTVHWDFVAAVMQAGYHVELAGGGYFDAAGMTTAIEKLAAHVPPGRGITCNLIYASPHSIAFQIPLIRSIIQRGIPIDGLTIGAGVPSQDVVNEWIQTLGIKHLSLKPGSIAAIYEVIEIAKKHPTFPIILQWTGGRGGGHHSCEDFHEPLLQTYRDIRRCSNLYLVVGSGFGQADQMHPYITGEWSLSFGRPVMPCDGILIGSRMMVAREAHTSPQAKELILAAAGVADSEWEQSFKKPTGGVLTVQSEMGQPIHKLATRGVRLWHEMDKTIFSLPRDKRVAALNARKAEIIRRLSADFAKPWFGYNAAGDAVDLEDMTYTEVIARLIRLVYVSHQHRWIDPSYRQLVLDFTYRTLERVSNADYATDKLDLSQPEQFVEQVQQLCPATTTRRLHPDDVRFFLTICKQRGRKPVNFIPALDEDFEYWFKKDSLWQSEDVDAIIDQDADRVCILQGPVAVQYSRRADQSAREILDEIHHGLANHFEEGPSQSDRPSLAISEMVSARVTVTESNTHRIIRPTSESLPSVEDWQAFLASQVTGGVRSAIMAEEVLRGSQRQANPLRRVLEPRTGQSIQIPLDGRDLRLVEDAKNRPLVHIKPSGDQEVAVDFYYYDFVETPGNLRFTYKFDSKSLSLVENLDGRDDRVKLFYAHLWLGRADLSYHRLSEVFEGEEITLSSDLHRHLHNALRHTVPDATASATTNTLPLEAAIIAAWKPLMEPLFVAELQGDLLRLVHLSNSIRYTPGAAPLEVNDVVTTKSQVRAVTIKETGKTISVEAQIFRSKTLVATVTSEFFIKGSFSDYETTFSHQDEAATELKVQSAIDEALLRDREWFLLDDPTQSLIDKTLVFRLHTVTRWKDQSTFTSLKTTGSIYTKHWNGTEQKVGTVASEVVECHGNPVIDFLQRKGTVVQEKVPLKHPGLIDNGSRTIRLPLDNALYSSVSKDYNPIHTSSVFARFADLPGTITHGMYTAAVSRAVTECLAADGETGRLRSFSASFVGMVLPGDQLTVRIRHEAMCHGRMVLSVAAYREGTDEKVLQGEAEVEQRTSAYLFTGQGSQAQNMGMQLYDSSAVARSVWDEVDRRLLDQYGWSILNVVRANPKQITIHFRGARGRRIRDNYLAMRTETRMPDGSTRLEPILRDLTAKSESYTFFDSRGLLYATQFAQPAILLMEKAAFEDMKANGLIQEGAAFAGHSLGEYGVLASLVDFLPFEMMMSVVFYRGLVMQFTMERDSNGHTGFSMVAVSPKRVGKYFDEAMLRIVVDLIHRQSGKLLEIVNFNVEAEQYVCAGHVRNIYILSGILDLLSRSATGPQLVASLRSASDPAITDVAKEIAVHLEKAPQLNNPTELKRGRATIPLQGIDVPFHSSHLRSGVSVYRRFLEERIQAENVQVDRLVGKFIPNVMGKPFAIDRSYLEEAAAVTGSSVLRKLALAA
ncbi:enoyl reductase domain of FAS1 [Aspergillus oryzae 100-8]|uniref:Enoyl reductase domain of FAS1 n=1 Tax=Aspergillus oryzae (strain 3.042) TaxID=1160506 RepID=I7ZU24_ASPO3|nr:enoyl reductase domain of FAS1 [Aspergillus oryzae 3.042]KDE81918.1 enoyl reductase domain of FAS1 [Aspergillus oryzae 100-8]|eukprot:EIT75554.1 enoyl reductase domain of FAS1 [Aspergillus oryzae 3.042]